VALTTHLHLTPRLKKEYSYTSTPPLGLRGLLWGELYLYLRCFAEMPLKNKQEINLINFKERCWEFYAGPKIEYIHSRYL
jgi:hypothetical protein